MSNEKDYQHHVLYSTAFLWCLDIQQNPQQIRQLGLYKSLEVLNLSAWMNTGFVIFTNVAGSIAQSLYKNCVLTILRV